MASTPTESKAFVQGRFEELPETPHKAHDFFATEGLELDLESQVWGSMRVHVRKMGAGPPLFLIHGLMTSSYSWRYVYRSLGEHYTCYAPDLPGAGRSDRPTHVAYTPERLARWLAEVMQALDIWGCDAIGNSMGGYLAMQLALQSPGAFKRLVNLHSPGVPEPRLYALKAIFSMPGSRALLRWLVSRDPLRWAHKNVHYYDESLKSLEEAKEYGGPLTTREGIDAFYSYLADALDVSAMRRFHARLSERRRRGEAFPMPLLLMYARRDPMVPPRFGEVFARQIPSAQLVHLEQASHFAHVDAVDAFLPPVLSFFGLD